MLIFATLEERKMVGSMIWLERNKIIQLLCRQLVIESNQKLFKWWRREMSRGFSHCKLKARDKIYIPTVKYSCLLAGAQVRRQLAHCK